MLRPSRLPLACKLDCTALQVLLPPPLLLLLLQNSFHPPRFRGALTLPPESAAKNSENCDTFISAGSYEAATYPPPPTRTPQSHSPPHTTHPPTPGMRVVQWSLQSTPCSTASARTPSAQ